MTDLCWRLLLILCGWAVATSKGCYLTCHGNKVASKPADAAGFPCKSATFSSNVFLASSCLFLLFKSCNWAAVSLSWASVLCIRACNVIHVSGHNSVRVIAADGCELIRSAEVVYTFRRSRTRFCDILLISSFRSVLLHGFNASVAGRVVVT